MSAMFTPQINEVDRQTQKSFSSDKSVETAGPLAMATPAVVSLLGAKVGDEFSSSNPFAQSNVDYSQYSESPVSSAPITTSYELAMSGAASFSADCSSFDGGCSVSDGGFSGGGGDCGGGSCGGFTASC